MEEFDTKKFEKLKKRDKFLSISVSYLLFYMVIVIELLFKPHLLILLLLTGLWLWGNYKVVIFVGNGLVMSKESTNAIKNYVYVMPCSDETMRQLSNAVNKCETVSEKFYLQCLLADQAADRGDIQNAEQIIYSAETGIFEKYPKLAVVYFTVLLEMYYNAGDFDSVKRAFADGKPYFDNFGEKNAAMYALMLSNYIYYNTVCGNYAEAERLAEYKLKTSEYPKSVSETFRNFHNGANQLRAAECNLRNNNTYAAFRHCENALALLPAGTYFACKAQQLMEKINAVSQTV